MDRQADSDLCVALCQAFWSQEREHAVVLLDLDGRIVGWFGAAQRLFGAPAQRMLGQPLDVLFVPRDRADGQPDYERELARTVGRSDDDRWHLRADGSAVWVSGAISLLRDAGGAPIGYAKVMRDRTDMRALVETLENRVAGLQQQQETGAAWLNTLGHELRTPLQALSNAVRLLAHASAAGQPPEGALRIIDRQIAVLSRLADDLNDLARIDIGRLELRISRFELQALLLDSVAALQERAVAGQRALRATLPEAPIIVEADHDRLQQITLNLLDNALKHTGAGDHITVSAAVEGSYVVIRVEDDGEGIPHELLPRIFELFTQGARAKQGLGIGLALARDLAELHGGNLEVRSGGAGKGATFQLRLPQRARQRPAPAA